MVPPQASRRHLRSDVALPGNPTASRLCPDRALRLRSSRKSTDRPVVALMTPNKPTVVLSQPDSPKPTAGAVIVEAVEIEPGGKFHVSGRARAGATVRLYLNDSFVAPVTAGADGRFAVTINEGVAPGSYRVRVDEMESNSSSGARTRRGAVQCSRPGCDRDSDGAGRSAQANGHCRCTAATIGGRRRDCLRRTQARPPPWSCRRSRPPRSPAATRLWRLSQATYGVGTRYATIYKANRAANPQSQPYLSRPGLCHACLGSASLSCGPALKRAASPCRSGRRSTPGT